jgi:hypothetical protein
MNHADNDHDYGADNGDFERVCLRMWFAEDLRATLRAAEQHALNHSDGAADLLRDLAHHAGLLGWHLDKRRAQLANTANTANTNVKEPSR